MSSLIEWLVEYRLACPGGTLGPIIDPAARPGWWKGEGRTGMRIAVDFQDERLDFYLPDDRVVGHRGAAEVATGRDAAAMARDALESPLDFPPLSRAVVPGAPDLLQLDAITLDMANVHIEFDQQRAAELAGLREPDKRKVVLTGAGAIGSQVANQIPALSTSAGYTYEWNPELEVLERWGERLNRFEGLNLYFGGTNIVSVRDGRTEAAGDPRRDGDGIVLDS